MSQEWLVCYQVGLNNGSGHANGDINVTINAMTVTALKEIRAHIRDVFIKENPGQTSVQNVVFTSLVKLESA